MKVIPLHGKLAAGRSTLIDDADWPLVAGYRWRVLESARPGRRPHGPYAMTAIRRDDGTWATQYMHSLITGWPMTDHEDHNGLNNQRTNLRPATQAQNQHNQRPGGPHSSRYKGVTWHRAARKWTARLGVNGRRYYLGSFASEIEAALAYNTAAIELHGEYACLNVIEAAA